MLKYALTLFAFDLSPGLSFAIVARNVILSKSLKIGLFAALGVACSDGMSGLLVMIGFSVLLSANQGFFLLLQTLGLVYLMKLSVQMFFAKPVFVDMQNNSQITTKSAFIDGFVFTFSNVGVFIPLSAILSQFITINVSIWHKIIMFLMIPAISFISFALIAFAFSIPVLQKLLTKRNDILDKMSSICLFILVLMRISPVLASLKKFTTWGNG
ncbi:MAG: LysE type translocator [Pseudomonadota bacterium]